MFLIADNPAEANGVDLEKSSVDSTNNQFHFETEQKLQEQLALDYDSQVSACMVWVQVSLKSKCPGA